MYMYGMPGGQMPPGYGPLPHTSQRPMGQPLGQPMAMPAREDFQGLATRIETYLKDQATAAAFYRELGDLATNQTIKGYLQEAMEDEQKHYRLLRDLYQQITGRTIEASPGKESYASLRDGLIKAADDEIHAYEEYKDEYQRFTDPQIRTLFFELFSDEIEHATRFNTALHILA